MINSEIKNNRSALTSSYVLKYIEPNWRNYQIIGRLKHCVLKEGIFYAMKRKRILAANVICRIKREGNEQ